MLCIEGILGQTLKTHIDPQRLSIHARNLYISELCDQAISSSHLLQGLPFTAD